MKRKVTLGLLVLVAAAIAAVSIVSRWRVIYVDLSSDSHRWFTLTVLTARTRIFAREDASSSGPEEARTRSRLHRIITD
ncbi:MAG TPA: hypothetical protein VGM03_10750 [Phycisphaerae bacterium]